MNEQDARQSIISATKSILEEVDDVEKITIRQITERASVGIGLINYHFKSKDNLLSIAIGDIMSETIIGFTHGSVHKNLDPVAKLKKMMKKLYSLAGENEKLIRFLLTREIMSGNMYIGANPSPFRRNL